MTGETLPVERMVRFVIAPDGAVVPDIAARLPGRGYWLAARREAVEKAVSRRIFIRAAAKGRREALAAAKETAPGFGEVGGADAGAAPNADVAMAAPLRVDPEMADQVERLLVKSSLGLLGLARRAGQLITGFEKVREAVQRESDILLLHAADAAGDGTQKLSRLGFELREINIFSRDELSLALGRENVVHAALKPGGIKDRFLAEINRLEGFRQAAAPRLKAIKAM